jgi:hypothetical protein
MTDGIGYTLIENVPSLRTQKASGWTVIGYMVAFRGKSRFCSRRLRQLMRRAGSAAVDAAPHAPPTLHT